MNLTEERDRGSKALQILNNPLFVEALNTIRSSYFDAWRNSGSADSREREHYWFLFNAVDEFEGHLTNVLKTGEMAEKQIFNKN